MTHITPRDVLIFAAGWVLGGLSANADQTPDGEALVTKTMFDPKVHGYKDGLWTCKHICWPEHGVTSGSQPAIDPCPWCEIERLHGLLRRALPDLKWAEKAADQEYSSSLDDMEIISDIEAEVGSGGPEGTFTRTWNEPSGGFPVRRPDDTLKVFSQPLNTFMPVVFRTNWRVARIWSDGEKLWFIAGPADAEKPK